MSCVARHGHCVGGKLSQTWNSWMSMKARCNNPNRKNYKRYGGRGIQVCERWNSFDNFLADMGERPAALSLDRIDNDGHYSPDNCRWASRREQNNNRCDNLLLSYRGRTQTCKQWADELGMQEATMRWRVYRGWSIERAMTQPVQRRSTNVKSFPRTTRGVAGRM